MKNEFSPLQPHSNYGFSKMVAEQVVQNYSKSWTIFRLGGLFGEGMSKGPLFDLINQLPLRLMGNSTLQLMNTSWAAKILLDIATGEAEREIFNLASSEPLTILEISKCLSLKPIFAAEAYSYYSRLDVSKISSLNRIQSQYDQLKDFVWSRT
jgi:nucleoside-diphosphate-sugar epimerase